MSLLNPLSWFRSQPDLPVEEKASEAGPVYSARVVGRPIWTPHDYEKMAREAYKLNAIGFRCAKMIATNSAGVRLMLMGADGAEIEKHPLLDLLSRPSPMVAGPAFFEQLYSYLLLSGNSYLEAVGPSGKPPRELYSLRSDRMNVLPGPFGIPQGFRYKVGGTEKVWDVDPMTGESDILHLKEFNPTDDWYGQPRVEPASYAIDRHNAASGHNMALLNNGARPSGALIFEPIAGANGQMASAPDEVIKAAEKELEQRHTGPSKAGRPMVMGGKVKWEEMGLSPRDMDFEAGKDDAARDACIAWGVPHILIVKGSSTYNNIREAKLELYEETVLPLMEMVVGGLNHWLAPRFGEGLKLVADLDSVSALEPRRETKRKSITELVDSGILDTDEGREELDYGERKETTVRKVEALVLKALIEGVEVFGMDPLMRYMKSVGLLDPKATEKEVLERALQVLNFDDDDDEDGNDDAPTEGDDPDAGTGSEEGDEE